MDRDTLYWMASLAWAAGLDPRPWYKAFLEAEIASRQLNTDQAITLYLDHLLEVKGERKTSVDTARFALRAFFADSMAMWALREKHCQERYSALVGARKTVVADDGTEADVPRFAVDTHRNYLGQAKMFLDWCVAQRFIASNPAATVKGVGKRRRGKPQPRIRQARAWFAEALRLANEGDGGALASLIALLMGLRASEIVHLKVGDLDTAVESGDTLWIDAAKTPKGEGGLEVPEEIRVLLLARTEGRPSSAWIFPARIAKRATDGPRRPHDRGWPAAQVKRIAAAAGLPAAVAKSMTAHGLRGMLATIGYRRGTPGDVVAEALRHEDERTSRESYAKPGAPAEGARRRGLTLLRGGKS